MFNCTVPRLDYGLPSLSTSRLLNSINRYYEHDNSLTATEQPDVSQTMDVLLDLMLRPPGMEKYKDIHLDNNSLTARQWIELIEVFFKNVSYTVAPVTGLAERR